MFRAITVKSVAVNLLNKFISYYELLHGPLTLQIDAGYSLADTFDDYVPCYIGAEGGTVPHGIRYAPVDRHCIVATHSLGLEMLYEFSEFISEYAIMYKGHLISSSIAPESLVSLYSYLVLCSRTGSVSNTKLLNPPTGEYLHRQFCQEEDHRRSGGRIFLISKTRVMGFCLDPQVWENRCSLLVCGSMEK